MEKHIMVFGAHALDAELMGGPVLAKFCKRGYQGTIVHLTRGERGNPKKPPEVYGKQIEEEMVRVAQGLGAQAVWMGYPAGSLPPLEQIALDICKLIREKKPTVVITHWRGSLHPRHVLTHDAVVEGIRLAADGKIETGSKAYKVPHLYFGENCEDLNGFIPQVYIDIEDTFEEWFAALRNYELFRGGILSVPYEDYYRTMAKIRGIEVGLKLCRAFMVAPHVQDSLDE
ncbi:mycothiol S-conjugate amidase [Peptococcaceae bacterium CEB3]|nr:mycothiol S-conjugate amidase [Peptococcaceae bacterium CEB3]